MPADPQIGPASAGATECSAEVLLPQDGSLTVRELMLTQPKTLPSDATVGDLRRLFANPKVLDVVLVDGKAFAGLVDREGVDGLPDETPAQDLAQSSGVTIAPDVTLDEALDRLERDGGRRLVVIGSDGITLEGLLCLNATRTGFCR